MQISTPAARARSARLALMTAALLLPVATVAEPPASRARPRACPSRDFAEFLAEFERSAETQRAFTRFPLPMRYLDDRAVARRGERLPVEGLLSRAEVKFPFFPDPRSRARDEAHLRVELLTPDRAKATILGNDSGYRIVYVFERDACWRLVLVDDQSL